MAGKRQPIEVLQAKGRKHLTKAEIENRKKTEIDAPDDKVIPPSFLTAKQKKRFNSLAAELMELKIISNLDCEALGRLIVVEEDFAKISKELKKTPLMVNVRVTVQKKDEYGNPIMIELEEKQVNPTFDKLQVLRDRAFKECRQGAADFGLTITSRCRISVPVAKEPPKENKFMRFAKTGNE